MANETNTFETFKQKTAADLDNATATAQSIVDKGSEAYGKAEQVVGEAYDKTSQKVKETYEKAKSYSDENQGKTLLIALGIGVGIGLLLGTGSSYRSRTGRFAEPVINALSDIAHQFYR
jgi:ElaB/YqjD/DUF883 family membrane-anchored ribosome-binding protein